MSEKSVSKKLAWWAWVLIGLGVLIVICVGAWGVSSIFVRNNNSKVAIGSEKTYEQVTLVVEAPKDFLRMYFGYDGANSEGYQPLVVDEQSDNRRTGKVSLVVPTGYDLLLNARVDMGMGSGTKFGFLSDPKNVSGVSISVKETGKRLSMSEKDLVLRKTGDSKVPTPILRFNVTRGGGIQSASQTVETAIPSAQSDVIVVGPPPAKK